jgi:hypothetical protein
MHIDYVLFWYTCMSRIYVLNFWWGLLTYVYIDIFVNQIACGLKKCGHTGWSVRTDTDTRFLSLLFSLLHLAYILEMATSTYPTGSGHPHPHLHPPLCTRRVTRTRTRVEKCSRTRTRAGKFYPTGNSYLTSYPRITCKYQIFTYKNKSFQASNKLQTNIHIMTSLQYI